MNENEKINYVEFPAKDMEATKQFFISAFGWSFVDYDPEYTAFSNAGIDGGFYKSDLSSSAEKGSVLVVLYSGDLEESQMKVEKSGGKIIKSIFSLPGGCRFHFADPSGNELAIWSDKNA